MSIYMLDRARLRLREAVARVVKTLPDDEQEAGPGPTLPCDPACSYQMAFGGCRRHRACEEFQVALRDGDLHATGRLSTTEAPVAGWRFHSGHATEISPAEWRQGQLDWIRETLTLADCQYIDITVARFAVDGIWPQKIRPALGRGATADAYTTPYLDLLSGAIAMWEITPANQPKKDALADWFRSQQVDGEPISENLANAMATLVRLPSAQRGGLRRPGNPATP